MSTTSRKVKDTKLMTHTIYGQSLMTANALGLDYRILKNTTLNEHFSIQEAASLNKGEVPRIAYFCIGDGGHAFTTTNRNGRVIAKPELYKHNPQDAGLWGPIPFVLRRTNNDLTAEERAKYALRRREEHGGIEYFAYYAKRLDLTDSELQIFSDTMQNGVLDSVPFVASSTELFPTRPTLPPRGVTVASNQKYRNNVEVTINFSEQDANEFLNVAEILNGGDTGYAIISEIGLCSGVDRNVTVTTSGGQPLQFKEVVGCQISAHLTTFRQIEQDNGGFKVTFDLGSRRPTATSQELDTTAIYEP